MMEYRANYLTGIIGVFFPILIQYFVWKAVFSNKGADETVFGYTFIQILTYSITAGFIAKLLSAGFLHEVAGDIKSGNLSKFLIQPIKHIFYRTSYFFGEKTSEALIIFCIMTVILYILAPILELQITLRNIFIFFLDLLPALILSFLLYYCISLIAFWIIEVGHVFGVIDILIAIASGSIFPLDIFGPYALEVFKYLPFTYTTYFLTNIISGKMSTGGLCQGILIQFVWIVLLSIVSIILWKQGLKKYVAVGG